MVETQQNMNITATSEIPLKVNAPSWERVRPSSKQIWAFFGILSLLLVISLYHFGTFQLGTWTDDATYVTLARSLIETHQYGMINYPDGPVYAKYPFVFPMALTPILRLFPGRFDLLTVVSLLATLANAALLFWGWPWFSNNRSYRWGLAVVGLYALNPITIDHTRMVMSEPIFLTFCLTTILLAEQYVRDQKIRGWPFWMALSVILMSYSRSIGLVMLPFICGYLILKKGRLIWKDTLKVFVYLLTTLAFLLLFTPVKPINLLPLEYFGDRNAGILQTFSPGSNPAGTAQNNPGLSAVTPSGTPDQVESVPDVTLSRLVSLIKFGVRQHLGSDIRSLVLPFGGGYREQAFFEQIGLPFGYQVIGYLVSIITIAGMLYFAFRNRLPLFMVFALVYLPLLFFWMWNTPRLLYPIQAQLFAGFLVAFEIPVKQVLRKMENWQLPLIVKRMDAASLLMVILFTLFSYKSLILPESTAHTGDLRLRDQWLLQNANPSDILMTESPQLDYLYSGLHTVDYPLQVDETSLVQHLKQNHVNLILIAPRIAWEDVYQAHFSEIGEDVSRICGELAAQGKLTLIHESQENGIRIYRVNPEGL